MSIIQKNPSLGIAGHQSTPNNLLKNIYTHLSDVLIIDYTSEFFDIADVQNISKTFPQIKMIGITDYKNKEVYMQALELGLHGHILNCCDAQEVYDAIESVFNNNQFYCGKVLDVIQGNETSNKLNCQGLELSEREIEIISMIAEGLTNKEIAEKLFLSTHTVMTHRKNIMQKLGITNTAGLVLYAVKKHLISPNKFLFQTA